MNSPLKIALVGLRGINDWMYRPAIGALPEIAALTGGVDPNPEARAGFTERTGLPAFETLSALMHSPAAPEAVVIGTPNPYHRANAEEALEAGLHVSVTKPLCNSSADADTVLKKAAGAGRVLQCAHEYRFRPPVAAAREWVKNGRLGELTLLSAHMGSRAGLSKLTAAGTWRNQSVNVPGGCLNMLGIHMFDVANAFLGRPCAVSASLRKLRTPSGLEDTAAVLVEYESGALCSITSSYVSPVSDVIHIHGTAGNALIVGDHLNLETEPEPFKGHLEAVSALPEASSGMEVIRHFCLAVREGIPAEPSGMDGLLAVRMLECAIESQKTGRKVVL